MQGSNYQFTDINNERAALRGRFTSEALVYINETRRQGRYSEFQAPANCFPNRSKDRSIAGGAHGGRVYGGCVRFLHDSVLDDGTRSLAI